MSHKVTLMRHKPETKYRKLYNYKLLNRPQSHSNINIYMYTNFVTLCLDVRVMYPKVVTY